MTVPLVHTTAPRIWTVFRGSRQELLSPTIQVDLDEDTTTVDVADRYRRPCDVRRNGDLDLAEEARHARVESSPTELPPLTNISVLADMGQLPAAEQRLTFEHEQGSCAMPFVDPHHRNATRRHRIGVEKCRERQRLYARPKAGPAIGIQIQR